MIMVLILLAPKHQKSMPATKTQLISKVQEDQNSHRTAIYSATRSPLSAFAWLDREEWVGDYCMTCQCSNTSPGVIPQHCGGARHQRVGKPFPPHVTAIRV